MAEVSIIMPAYNVASYLEAAVDSVRAQTFEDWELLISDDGSTDRTVAVAEARASQDRRVQVLTSDSNRGISSTRNRALRRASGRFITLLDSDDLWTPAYLEKQLRIFAERPDVDLVTGNAWLLGGSRSGEPARPWPDTRPHPTLIHILGDETAVFIMTMMRRRVWEIVGPFDEALRTNEDYDYWLRAAMAGLKFYRNDEPLGHYRRRDDSLSADDVRMILGVLRVYEKVEPMLSAPEARRVLDAQVGRFRREQLAAQAKEAIHSGKVDVAADHLSALYALGGDLRVKLASVLARWAPGLFSRAYQIRRDRQGAAPPRPL